MTFSKLTQALDITRYLGEPKKTYVWEQSVYLQFEDEKSVRFYFDTFDKLEEIHVVDCDVDFPVKVKRVFRSVR